MEWCARQVIEQAFPFFGAGTQRGRTLIRVLDQVLSATPDPPCGAAGLALLVRALQELSLSAEARLGLVAEIRQDMDRFLLLYADAIAECVARSAAAGEGAGDHETAVTCDIISVGCGAGWKEEILARRIAQRLRESRNTEHIAVQWIGLDKPDPDSEPVGGLFRPEHNYFQVDACQTASFVRAARAGATSIIIASYLVHHLPLTPEEFLDKCADARAVVLLEEPISAAEARDPRIVLARLAYEVLANYAFNAAMPERILQAADGYWLRYWTDADIARLHGRGVDIPEVSPRTSILVFDNPRAYPRTS